MTSSLAITAAGITVTLEAYQWEYTDGVAYGERNVLTTEVNTLFRERTGTIQRFMRVRFVNLDSVIDSLRRLSMVAGRKALPVVFTPDTTVPGVSWIVDWPVQHRFKRPLENRQEFEVTLLEQSPGV